MKVQHSKNDRLLRCVWCHDTDDTAVVYCENCSAMIHESCVAELRECPTLGCEFQFKNRAHHKRPSRQKIVLQKHGWIIPGYSYEFVSSLGDQTEVEQKLIELGFHSSSHNASGNKQYKLLEKLLSRFGKAGQGTTVHAVIHCQVENKGRVTLTIETMSKALIVFLLFLLLLVTIGVVAMVAGGALPTIVLVGLFLLLLNSAIVVASFNSYFFREANHLVHKYRRLLR